MKLAFVMLTHREPDSLQERLLTRLREIPNTSVGVHHDFGQCEIAKTFFDKHKLHSVRDWKSTQWGHHSKVPATLEVFRLLYEQTDAEWFITISPNCYPVAPLNRIVDFFESNSCDALIQMRRVTQDSPLGILRNKYRFLFTRPVTRVPWISRRGRLYLRDVRIPRRRSRTPFAEIDPFQGSDWFAIRRNVVKRMLAARLDEGDVIEYLKSVNEHPRTLVSPIEMVIQTFIGNESGLNIDPKNYRYIDWTDSKNYHPNTLTMKHWDAIVSSGALFARKFVDGESNELLDRIDEELLEIES